MTVQDVGLPGRSLLAGPTDSESMKGSCDNASGKQCPGTSNTLQGSYIPTLPKEARALWHGWALMGLLGV